MPSTRYPGFEPVLVRDTVLAEFKQRYQPHLAPEPYPERILVSAAVEMVLESKDLVVPFLCEVIDVTLADVKMLQALLAGAHESDWERLSHSLDASSRFETGYSNTLIDCKATLTSFRLRLRHKDFFQERRLVTGALSLLMERPGLGKLLEANLHRRLTPVES